MELLDKPLGKMLIKSNFHNHRRGDLVYVWDYEGSSEYPFLLISTVALPDVKFGIYYEHVEIQRP